MASIKDRITATATSVTNGKKLIKDVINSKGGNVTSTNPTFKELADGVERIKHVNLQLLNDKLSISGDIKLYMETYSSGHVYDSSSSTNSINEELFNISNNGIEAIDITEKSLKTPSSMKDGDGSKSSITNTLTIKSEIGDTDYIVGLKCCDKVENLDTADIQYINLNKTTEIKINPFKTGVSRDNIFGNYYMAWNGSRTLCVKLVSLLKLADVEIWSTNLLTNTLSTRFFTNNIMLYPSIE